MKSKVKEFVSLTVYRYYFLMACFKTIHRKQCSRITQQVHALEVPVFVASLTEFLSFVICQKKKKCHFVWLVMIEK